MAALPRAGKFRANLLRSDAEDAGSARMRRGGRRRRGGTGAAPAHRPGRSPTPAAPPVRSRCAPAQPPRRATADAARGLPQRRGDRAPVLAVRTAAD